MRKYKYLIMLFLLVSAEVESKESFTKTRGGSTQKNTSVEKMRDGSRSKNSSTDETLSPEEVKDRFNRTLIEIFKRDRKPSLRYVVSLIKHGADVNVKDSRLGETALMFASQKGYFKAVKLLLSAGADPNIKNNDGETALYYASMSEKTELRFKIMDALLNNGKKKCNPLYPKCKKRIKTNVNIRDNNGRTVLTMVKQSDLPKKEKQAVISLLKKHGATG